MPKKGQYKDITGQRFGRLVAISFDRREEKDTYWRCRCDCGAEVVVRGSNLGKKSGGTTSCGCLHRELTSQRRRTHGGRNTPLYKIWQGMKERCYGKYSIGYRNYGERGITVCDEWKEDFVAFRDWAISHGYSDDKRYQLDRIDNDKGYSPTNCRFITRVGQANNKRNNRIITYNGETKTAAEWARLFGVDRSAMCKQLDKHGDDLSQVDISSLPAKDWGDPHGKQCGVRQERERHDKPKSSLYNIWWSTRAQCCNPGYNRYAKFGAKGITICDEWKESRQAFEKWALETGYEEGLGLILKRRDENGPFSPDNCCWDMRRMC